MLFRTQGTLWSLSSTHMAIMGIPIGLNRKAMVRRINPFFREYATRTAIPRSAMTPLMIRRGIAKEEIISMQTSVNRSISRIIGVVSFLRIHFMGCTSFTTSLYSWWGYSARIWDYNSRIYFPSCRTVQNMIYSMCQSELLWLLLEYCWLLKKFPYLPG